MKLNFNHPTKELIWVCQPYDNVDSSKTGDFFGPQWFNYTDDYDVTYTSASSFSVSDSYGGVVDPAVTAYNTTNLSGGLPGVAAGGANRVYVPTSFEGGDNPISTAKIQLNGHDRFAEMDGRYFNLVQPYATHENIPSCGINVYSFGLKPEEHQPSGTCNFSRIDAANLNITLTPKTVLYSGSARTAAIRVFAVNYNVKIGVKQYFNPMLVNVYQTFATLLNCEKLRKNPSYHRVKNMDLGQFAAKLVISHKKVQRLNRSGLFFDFKNSLRYSPSVQFKRLLAHHVNFRHETV